MIKNIVRKFVDFFSVEGWEVKTDSGWSPISNIGKTEKYALLKLRCANGRTLKAADDHIIFDSNMNEIFVKDVIVNVTQIMTNEGPSTVTHLKDLNKQVHMYDIQVADENHRYYTNGILSHNTTISSLFILHYLLFNSDKTVAILANKEETAKEVLRRIKLAYERLPYWLQQGIAPAGWNATSISLENGSKIVLGTTTSSSIRSKSVSLLYIDEFAHIPEHMVKDFMEAVFPTLYSRKTSRMIISSTPKGLNSYYDIYTNAVKGKTAFNPIFVPWYEVPGRDEKFKQDIINNFGEMHWRGEYAAEFIGSSSTLVDGYALQRMDSRQPMMYKYGSMLAIYEMPDPKAMYILGVDASKGVGKDEAVIQVLKLTNEHDCEQVAIYRNSKIEPYAFAQVCIEVSKFYNESYMLIENNGEGAQTCDAIWYQFEYDKLINMDKTGLGIKSTSKSKLSACLVLKRYIENNWISLHDKETIRQLSTFEEVSPNVFRGPEASHDDCVTSLMWATYFLTTNQYDGYGNELRLIDNKFRLNKNEDDSDAGSICIIDE